VPGFDAFVSYSRRASTTLATDLQAAVERFAKPWYRLRAVRVFRDDASMSANPALWSSIERGLTEAEWFVLLASPLAAQSEYVARELAWWREHKSGDRILIVLEEGVDLVWDRAANDFDFDVTDSLPLALSGAYAEEPRWVDLRWYEAEGSLGAQDPRWMERVADIAAAVRGAERDELIGENVREHRRAQRVLRAGIALLSLLLVASLVATFVAVGQRSEANKQRSEAVRQPDAATEQATIALARQLAAEAVSVAPTDLQTASLLAVQAYRTNADAQTRAALFQIATASPQLVRPMDVGDTVLSSAVTPKGVVVTGDASGRVQLWAGSAPQLIATLERGVTSVAVSGDGRTVAAADGLSAVLWTGDGAVPLEGVPGPASVQLDGAGAQVAVTDSLAKTGVWSVVAGQAALRGVVHAWGGDLAFGPNGLSMYGPLLGNRWFLVDPTGPSVLARGGHPLPGVPATAVSADGATFAGFDGTRDINVWNGQAVFSDSAPANAVAHTDLALGNAIAVSADGSEVAQQADGQIQVAAVQPLDAAPERPMVLDGAGPLGPGNSEALSFGGDRYLVSTTGSTALLWDLRQFSRFGTSVRAPVPAGCTACGPARMTMSPDGTRVALWAPADFDTGPVVITLQDGSVTRLDPKHRYAFDGLAWNGDDRLVSFSETDSALMALSPDGASQPVDLAPVELTNDYDTVQDVVVASGIARLVSRDGDLFSVDLASSEVTRSSALMDDGRAKDGSAWQFAPDGSSLAIQTVDADKSELLLVHDSASDRITFAGPAIASAYDGQSRVHVFDGTSVATLDDGELVDRQPAPGVEADPAPVLSPDGDAVVTGGNASDQRLLDLERQGAEFGRIPIPQQSGVEPTTLFTPDGRTLVTALPEFYALGLPSTLRTVSLDPHDWIAAACQVGARDLTEDDWSRYGVGPAPDDLRCVQ
jgi:WD40 repeat protein